MKLIQNVVAVTNMQEIVSRGGIARVAFSLFGDNSYDIMCLPDTDDTWLYAKNMFINLRVTPAQAIAWQAVVTRRSNVTSTAVNIQMDLDKLAEARDHGYYHDILVYLRDTYTTAADASEPVTARF